MNRIKTTWRRAVQLLNGGNWRRALLDMLQIAVGAFLIALAFNLFFVPNDVVPGGVSGIAILLRHFFGTPVGLVTLALNVPLFVAGLRWAGGLATGARTVFAVVVFSLALDLLPLPETPITENPLLYVSYGGLMTGLGAGLVFLAQGTMGGGGIVARLINRFTGLSVSRGIFLSDALPIVAAAIIFGLEQAMFGVMVVAISAWAMDVVLAGGRRARQALIISDEWEGVRDALLNDLHRGVTVLSAQGAFTGAQRSLLLCIINQTEVARLRRLVQEIDPAAFVIVNATTEVWGGGFGLIQDA